MKLKITGNITLNPFNKILSIPIADFHKAQELILEQQDAKYPMTLGVKQDRPKRSLNANNYAWQLIGEIAEKMNLSNQIVYEKMLQDYSKAYTFIIVKPEAVEQTKATLATAHIYAYEIGNKDVDGSDGIQMQLYYGSSTFDTKQMSRLIDGIVTEAKELGIETATPAEISRMKEEWKK